MCENEDGKQVEMDARFQDGSRRSSRCKPGDRNFGGVARAARKRTSMPGKKKKGLARVHRSQTLSQHGTIHGRGKRMKKGRMGRRKKGEGEEGYGDGDGWHQHYCLPASSSSDLSLDAPDDRH